MFILALKDNPEGVYTVINELEEKVLLVFENEDDAERYAIMLNENNYPQVKVVSYEDKVLLRTCEVIGQRYSIVGPYDLVVPPDCY
jgi:predicted transcriptional regulator